MLKFIKIECLTKIINKNTKPKNIKNYSFRKASLVLQEKINLTISKNVKL